MTFQTTIFDAIESERHRLIGIDAAANNNAVLLTEARTIARELSKGGTVLVNADMVQKIMYAKYGRDVLKNASGAMFRTRDWEVRGFTRATRVQSHSNLLREWQYIGK